MPTYEYLCASCGNAWEEIQKITEPAVEVCPSCHKATAKRQISGGTFILKGGGWYSDLYSSAKPAVAAKDDSSKAGESSDKAESKSETKSETKTESKTETKTETKAAAPETKKSSPPKGDGGGSSGGSSGSGGASKAAE